MTNHYLRNCKYAQRKTVTDFSGDYFKEGTLAASLTPDWLETPMQYYSKKYSQAMNVVPGVDTGVKGKGNIANLTGQGMVLTTLGDFFSELWDYSDTQAAAKRRNQDVWEYKVEVAQKLKNEPWPSNIPKKFTNIGKALPNVNLSVVLGVPPNSVADAYAQGALFAYLTAIIYNKAEFRKLGNALVFKAKKSPNSIKKPEVDINLADPVATLKSFARADKVVNAMKEIQKQWLSLANKTGVYPAWYNIPGQLSREWDAAASINSRLKLFSKPEEINFSRSIAKQSQSSFTDLLYVMKAPLILAGLGIAGVFLFPIIAPLLPTIGSGIASTARTVGTLTAKTFRALSGAASAKIEDVVKQGIMDKEQIENIVTEQLKTENPTISEQDIRKIIRQQLRG